MTNGSTIEIVVVGSANVDYTARGEALPTPGQAVDGDLLLIGPGGKGLNQAVAAARLGARAALVACVGEDASGDHLLRHLAVEGVNAAYVRHTAEADTGAAFIQVGGRGQKQTISISAANHRLSVADVDRAADVIRSARVLLVQLTTPVAVVRRAVELASGAGVKVILDPGRPETLPDDLYPHLWAVKPNDTEAEALTGIRGVDFESARRAARTLLERGVGAASVQAGKDGNLLVWPDGEVRLPHFRVDTVDATGAGDAFAAALAVGTVEGLDWTEIGWLASATAALTTTVMGVEKALPKRAAVMALLREQRALLA